MYYNNRRLALSIFWVVVGAVLVVLSLTEVLDSSVYAGMGGALMAVGCLQAIRNVKYRKDPEFREKVDIELSDERSKYLRMKSWAWTGAGGRRHRGFGSRQRDGAACTGVLRLPDPGSLLGRLHDPEQKVLSGTEHETGAFAASFRDSANALFLFGKSVYNTAVK